MRNAQLMIQHMIVIIIYSVKHMKFRLEEWQIRQRENVWL